MPSLPYPAGRRRFLAAGALAPLGLAPGLAAAHPAAVLAAGPTGLPVYDVRAFGAVGDGRTPDTAPLRAAIAACAAAGGGTVYVPPGTYLTAALRLGTRQTLYLEAGAVLLGSPNLEDYPAEGAGASGESERAGLVTFADGEDVGILGRGAIDGNALPFHRPNEWHIAGDVDRRYTRQQDDYLNPKYGTAEGPIAHGERPGNLVRFLRCRNVMLHGVTIRNAPTWTMQFRGCERVAVLGLSVHSLGSGRRIPNDDGMDFVDCRSVRIADCDIQTGDDCIAIFSGEGYTITNCTLASRSVAIRIGYNEPDIRDVTGSNLVIRSNRGIGIFARGEHDVERIQFTDVQMRTGLVTGHWWGKAEPIHVSAQRFQQQRIGRIRDVRFAGITASSDSGILLHGDPESVLEGIRLEDVAVHLTNGRLQAAYGGNFDLRTTHDLAHALYAHDIPALYARHTRGLRVDGLRVSYDAGMPDFFRDAVHIEDADDVVLRRVEARQPQAAGAALRTDRVRGLTVQECRAVAGTDTFLAWSGVADAGLFSGNDLAAARTAFAPRDPGFTAAANRMPARP